MNPEGLAAVREQQELVRTLLQELSEQDRLVLRRVLLEEEDKDLVCSELGVNRNYLRLLLHRARLRLREVVQRSGVEIRNEAMAKRTAQ